MTKMENPQKVCDQGWLLNVNKPVGKTSFDVVSYIRRLCNIKKVGHAGSLDPNASGVLLVAVGKATRHIEMLMDLKKEYIGTVRFGIQTDSYDIDGKIIEEREVGESIDNEIRKALESFSGTISQIPPRFSALKYKGKPLYKYARKGVVITPEPRDVHIYSIELLSYAKPDAKIRVVCSRGTYIRSIAHDLGQMLGCGAMLSGLIRERIGNYCLSEAFSWDELPAVVNDFITEQDGSN